MTTPILNQSKSDNNGDQKQKYRSLKKRLKVLIYENECFQEELRKCQKELIAIKCDEYFLLDKLLKYEDIQSTSSSDSDATDYSESEIDVKPLKPKSTAKRLKTNNGSINISQNTESTLSTGGSLKRKKTKSKGTIPIASQKSLITYGASHRNKDGISRGKKANESESTSSTSSTITTETPMAVAQMIPTTTQTVTGPSPPTSSSSSSSSSSAGFLNINSLVPNLSVPVSIGNSFYIATTPSTPCTTVPTKSSATYNQSSLLMAESITSSTIGPTASLLRPNLKVTTTPSSSISSTTANSMLKFAPLIQTTKLPSILSASKSSGLSLSVPLKPSSSPISTGNLKFSTKSATTTKLSTPTSSLHSQQQQQPLPSLSLSLSSSSTVATSTTIPVPTGTISTTIPFTCKMESKSISQTSKSTNQLTESTKTVVATKPTMSSMVTCKTESMPLIRTAKIPSILLISSTSASSSLPSTLTVAKTANSKTTTSTFTLQTESKSSIRTSNKTPSILLASKISASSSSSSSSLSLPISSSFSNITTLAPTTTKVSSSLSSTTSTTTTPKSESNLTSGWYLLTQPMHTSESPSILSTQEATNGGHFTLAEIERHFESRPIQSSLLLPEKTPLTLPSELFSND